MCAVTFVLPGMSRKPSGGYKVVFEYANYLYEQGHHVTLLFARPAQIRDATSPGAKTYVRSMAYRLMRRRRPSWYPLAPGIVVVNAAAQREADMPEADVIVATAMDTAEFVSQAASSRKTRGAYFIQHYEDWALGADAVDATWRLNLRKIVIAPWLQEVGNRLGVKTSLVPNAIDATRFPAGPAIADRPLQVLAQISDIGWKRADVLINVMNSIARQRPDVVLRTFGVIGRPAGLPSIAIHSQTPAPAELASLYQSSRVYLCTSDAEGWHLPPAEAMSSGAAVVSTDIGGVRAYADEIARFAPVGAAEDLAQAVVSLLDDEVECTWRAEAGRRTLLENTPQAAAQAFATELFRE